MEVIVPTCRVVKINVIKTYISTRYTVRHRNHSFHFHCGLITEIMTVTKPVPVPAFMELTDQWREPYDSPKQSRLVRGGGGQVQGL